MSEEKQYQFKDDLMFCTVLAQDEELARELIETILGKPVEKVKCVNALKILNYSIDVRSVRFDVYMKDEKDVVYDLEMETTDKLSMLEILPKRSRLYSGLIDADEVKKGTPYSKIKDAYIIFICLNDPFGKGLARYTCKTTCVEDNCVPVVDGITRIYLNCNAITNNVSKNVKALLDYISGKTKARSSLTKKINAVVKKINSDETWRQWAMTFGNRLDDAYEEGRIEGIEQGKKEGLLESRKKAIINLILGGFNNDTILVAYPDATNEEIDSIRASIRN